jgi:hypothetical protein
MTTEIRKLIQTEDYPKLIKKVKASLKKNKRNIKKPEIKDWCAKRFRNIFIQEASQFPEAVEVATRKPIFGKDTRSDKEKVAFRFLRGEGPEEWKFEFPPVEFTELKKTTLLFCPGLLTGLLPVHAFEDDFPYIYEKLGVRIIQSDSHPMRSCEANMADLNKAIDQGIGLDHNSELILEGDALPPKDIFVIAYSKGMPDLLYLLTKRPELKNRIRCIFNWAGAPGGSYLANSLYDSIKDLNFNVKEQFDSLLKIISPIIDVPHKVKRLSEYNVKAAILDLTTEIRGEFLKHNLKKIDSLNIPIFNITASTTVTEVPYFQIQGVMELNKFDANNDMQVTQKHSKLHSPMATDLAMLHGHHWDVSYNSFTKRGLGFASAHLDHPFPKKAALSAMIKFAFELGLID